MTYPCAIRVKVPDQSHGSQIKDGTIAIPMEISHGVEKTILIIHKPIKCVTCPVCLRVLKSLFELLGFATQIKHLFLDRFEGDGLSPFT
jgi:hypothetical protein